MRGDFIMVSFLVLLFLGSLMLTILSLQNKVSTLREEACKYNLAEWKTVNDKTGEAEFTWITNRFEKVETSTE